MATQARGGQLVDLAWADAATQAAALLDDLGHVVEEASPDGLDDPAYGLSLSTV